MSQLVLLDLIKIRLVSDLSKTTQKNRATPKSQMVEKLKLNRMKRSTFFLINAILSALFGSLLFFLPSKAAEVFKIIAPPEITALYRPEGAFILALGFMNFFVRNHDDNITLKIVLLTNAVAHALVTVATVLGLADGVITIDKLIPSLIVHLFVGIGSIIYAMRVKK